MFRQVKTDFDIFYNFRLQICRLELNFVTTFFRAETKNSEHHNSLDAFEPGKELSFVMQDILLANLWNVKTGTFLPSSSS